MFFQFLRNLIQKLASRWSSLLSVVWIGGLAVAALALWGFTEVAEEVLEKETQGIDRAILQWFENLHTPLLDISRN